MRKIFLLLIIFLVSSCQLPDLDADANREPTQAVDIDDAGETALTPEATAVNTPQPTPTNYTVTIWSPASFDSAALPTFNNVLTDFDGSLSDVTILFENKATEGAASLVNYLDSASAVAPSVLPDLIIIPSDQLSAIAGSGLLVPLDNHLDQALLDDLYPLAQQGRFSNDLLALPVVLSVSHGIIREGSDVVVPTRLAEMGTEESPAWLRYEHPQESGPLRDAELVQLASLNEKNGLLIAPNPLLLTNMLDEWQQVGATGNFPTAVNDHNALYAALRDDSVDFITDDSRTFLQQIQSGATLSYTHIPTYDGKFMPLAEGYLIAVSTEDPRRQATALALLEALMDPVTLSKWSAEGQWLPARSSALERSTLDAGYRDFAEELLQNAQLRPSSPNWQSFAPLYREQLQRLATDAEASPSDSARQLIDQYPADRVP